MLLFTENATFYAEKVKGKEMTATELVEAALLNIEQLNPLLNAVTHVQAKDALLKAAEFDQEIQRSTAAEIEQFPPFYGVPILLKDLGQSEGGQPETSGSKLLADHVAIQTDNFVQAILDAGFIVVGRTNVPEFGFKNETDAQLTGAANSPFDKNLNPGGSSGGAASALKAGLVPIVTASDGGGSIRIPASFNGLIGLKTSRGRIPVGPGSYRGWQGASVNFALTKSVRDTWTLLKTMQVEQFDAPFVLPKIEEKTLEPLNRSLKFAYSVHSPIGHLVTEDAKNSVLTAVEKLKELGHQVVEDAPQTDGIRAMQTYYMVNGVETAAMIEDIETSLNRKITVDDIEPMSWALFRSGLKISGIDYSQVLAFWDQLTAKTEEFFKTYDAFILPATNGPAFPHRHFSQTDDMLDKLKNIDALDKDGQQALIWKMFEHSLDYTPFTQQQNLTGQPAISLPLYEMKAGLPIGTQIWTKKGAEYLLLQIAQELEQANALKTNIVRVFKS